MVRKHALKIVTTTKKFSFVAWLPSVSKFPMQDVQGSEIFYSWPYWRWERYSTGYDQNIKHHTVLH
jgi:hypothetical protein